VRYLNLLDDAVEVALEIDAERSYLRVVRDSEAPAPASHELCFALVAKYARELAVQPFRVTRVDFAHAGDGAAAAAAREWFDAPVAFGADTTQLVLPRGALDLALRTSDPALLAILTRAADDQARTTARDPSVTAQVARVLRDLLREDAGSIEHVAKRLGVPPRSLQRRLKDEGTSFQVVRDATRKELAQRYLDARMSIAEISFLLGFSEPSAFFRAFKRWTGLTPAGARTT
jgi:AraC-like DNA-binding protein